MTNRRILIGLLATLALGCGGKAETIGHARDTLSVALSATKAAHEAMVAWDKAEQARIVDAARNEEEGRANLAAHRAARDRVVEGFALAYSSLSAAAGALLLADANELSAAEAASEVVRAAKRVVQAVHAFEELRR